MALQEAANTGDEGAYKVYAKHVNERPLTHIRDLLDLKLPETPVIDIKQVESKERLYQRFDTAAMSIGALSSEAHEALAIAMNRMADTPTLGKG